MKKLLLLISVTLSLCSCATVKEYDKVYLNDPDMALAEKPIHTLEANYLVYREGASGASGGNSGGGCGCN